MSQPDAWQMIRRRAMAAGIGAEIGCHTFRATGITHRRTPHWGSAMTHHPHLHMIVPGFRTYRKRLECVPIHDPPLHRDCVGSFHVYEPIAPEYQQHHWWRSRYYSRDARQRMYHLGHPRPHLSASL